MEGEQEEQGSGDMEKNTQGEREREKKGTSRDIGRGIN